MDVEADQKNSSQEVSALSQISLAIIDDSKFTRRILKNIIGSYGLKSINDFGGAKDALDFFNQNQPDIALIDIVMPDISGLELVKVLSENFPNIKCIMMSSLSQERIIVEAIGAGAVDFLQKD